MVTQTHLDFERPPAGPAFKPVGGLAAAVQAAVWVVLAALCAELVVYIRNWQLASEPATGLAHAQEQLRALDQTGQWLFWTSSTAVTVQLIGSLLFVVWTYRARSNAELFCAAPHRLPRAWAVAGFLPVVNWFLPPVLVDDIQRASDPALSPDSARLPANSLTKVVVIWWVAFVFGALLLFTGYLFGIAPRFGSEDATRAGLGVLIWLAGILVQLVAALAVTVLLRRVSAWQTSRARSGSLPQQIQHPYPGPHPALPQQIQHPYPGPPPALHDPRFGAPPVSVGRGLGITTALLFALVFPGPAVMALATPDYRTLDALPEDSPAYDAALDDWALPTVVGLLTLVLALLIAGVVFLCWLMRARMNADALRPHAGGLSRGWAIGAWFLPIANLIMPALVVYQVWRDSHPAQRSAGALVWVWWLAWISAWVVFWYGIGAAQTVTVWIGVSLLATAAILLAGIIFRIDRWQAEAAYRGPR
ncbi:DUF4328 domain-containing protein [Nocardia sp. NPDC051832]|uniref:DUF4328 domain-containing protein n=1 Tax=Nocardia sp. NPDC051832 TaxID=3155673 RepID=UPI003427D2CA